MDEREKKIEDNPVFQKVAQEWENFLDLPLFVEAELGRKMITLKDLLELNIGSIVELKQSAGESLNIFVNGSFLGNGEVTVIENTFGLRITEIYDHRKL